MTTVKNGDEGERHAGRGHTQIRHGEVEDQEVVRIAPQAGHTHSYGNSGEVGDEGHQHDEEQAGEE